METQPNGLLLFEIGHLRQSDTSLLFGRLGQIHGASLLDLSALSSADTLRTALDGRWERGCPLSWSSCWRRRSRRHMSCVMRLH